MKKVDTKIGIIDHHSQGRRWVKKSGGDGTPNKYLFFFSVIYECMLACQQ